MILSLILLNLMQNGSLSSALLYNAIPKQFEEKVGQQKFLFYFRTYISLAGHLKLNLRNGFALKFKCTFHCSKRAGTRKELWLNCLTYFWHLTLKDIPLNLCCGCITLPVFPFLSKWVKLLFCEKFLQQQYLGPFVT